MATLVKPSKKMGLAASRVLANSITYFLLVGIGCIVILPFWWMIATSLRTFSNTLQSVAIFWPESFYLGNWPEALSKFPFFLYLKNTLIITVPPIFLSIIASCLVAYGFSRFRTRWMGILFIVMLATLMVPGQILTIPIYVIFAKLHWVDTYLPFIVPSLFGGVFEIFLLRQFFLGIPHEMADSARVDGASELMILRHIYLPLSTAPIAALIVLDFLGRWNDYYGPSIYLHSQDKLVLQQGLNYLMGIMGATLGAGHDTMNMVPWNLLSAAAILITLPVIVVFFFAQKQFIEGIRFTGMKG